MKYKVQTIVLKNTKVCGNDRRLYLSIIELHHNHQKKILLFVFFLPTEFVIRFAQIQTNYLKRHFVSFQSATEIKLDQDINNQSHCKQL